MACLKKPVYKNLTEETLRMFKVDSPEQGIYDRVRNCWDQVAKPLDGMGKFETITAGIGAVQGSEKIDISRKAILIFCADNGIVEEGISQSGQDVTLAVMKNMAKEQSSVGKLARFAKVDTIPIDIGVNTEEKVEKVVDRKIRKGTRNFRKEPAMTMEETMLAISVGIEMVEICKEQGYRVLGTGEMGIGNTTTSSAVTASLLSCKASEVTGRGAGLSDEKLEHKCRIIEEAVNRYALWEKDPLQILQIVGGLDLAGLAGVCIGGAIYHIPIVLDGVISLAAALLAVRMVPGVEKYLIASHKGKEPAAEKLLEALSLQPAIEGELALGEGTGAVMMMQLLDMALCIYEEGATFSEIEVGQYERYTEK